MVSIARRRTSTAEDSEAVAVEAAALARRLLAQRRDDFIRELFDSLRRDLPDLAGDPRLAALLEAAVTENVVSLVNFLERGTAVAELDATSAALAHARTLAQRDVPLSSLFRAYRLGHAQFMDTGLEFVPEAPPELQGALTQLLVRRSAEFIDKVCEQVGHVYEAERDRWVSERGGIRQHWISEILAGGSMDAEAAESALGYRFGQTHLGVQMWTSPDVPEASARSSFEKIRSLLSGLVRQSEEPLVVPRDEHEMQAWFPVRFDFGIQADELTQALRSSNVPHAHVAVGPAQSGVEGFRLTMKQAMCAKDVVLTSTNPLPVAVTYDQLGAVALMMSDLEALRYFVMKALGPLAAHGEREEYLRATLRTFLIHSGSYLATSEEMILHRNTVHYRINQVTELCDRDIADISGDFNVQVALNAVHWLGRLVLAE